MSDNAPSVAPAPAVVDMPSSDSSNRAPSSDPTPVLPVGTSTEEAVVIAKVPGAFNRQLDDDANPNISEKTKAQRRRERYRRGGMYGAVVQREQLAADRAEHKTVLAKYGDDGRASEPNDDAQRERAERSLRQEETQQPQQEQPDDAAQYDGEAQQPEPEQYDGETQYDEQAPQHEQLTPEQRNEVVQRFGQEALQEIEAAATAAERVRVFAQQQQLPNYHEVLQSVSSDPELFIPHHAIKLIRHSEHGAAIAYWLASSVDGMEQLRRLRGMNHEQTAKWVGKAEATYEAGMRQRHAPPQSQQPTARRATQAPRPMTPLRGSASSPSQLATVNNYIKKLYGDRG